MPLNVPSPFAIATVVYGGANQDDGAVNTFAFRRDAPEVTPSAWAELIHADWAANIMPILTVHITLETVRVKFGPLNTGAAGEFSSQVAGSANTEPVAPNTALLVRKVTEQGGRAGRGRWFVPGIAEGATEPDGEIVPATLALYQTAFNDLYTDLVGHAVPITPFLLHDVAAPITTPTEITSFAVDNLVATQRRRLRR